MNGASTNPVPHRGTTPTRISDSDRDRAATAINEAVALGRISPEEHAERLDLIYAARFTTDLAPLTADLRVHREVGDLVRQPINQQVDATFSKVATQMVHQPSAHVHARSRFGKLILDMRQLTPDAEPTVVQADSFCGQIKLILPPGATVIDLGRSRMGQRVVPPAPAGTSVDTGPVIYLSGRTTFGQLKCQRTDRFWRPWRR